MSKRLKFLLVVLAVTTSFFVWFTFYYTPRWFDARWRAEALPKAERIIRELEDQGSDETIARFLCHKQPMTKDDGWACVNRLQVDLNALNGEENH